MKHGIPCPRKLDVMYYLKQDLELDIMSRVVAR